MVSSSRVMETGTEKLRCSLVRFPGTNPGERLMALREHFMAMFGVGVALGLFSASRFYMVSWLGERVTAVVQPVSGQDAGDELADALLDHLRPRIAKFKLPREVIFRDTLPRTPTGKLVKRKL